MCQFAVINLLLLLLLLKIILAMEQLISNKIALKKYVSFFFNFFSERIF